jgi:type VI secretion system protein ImpG
MDKKDNILRYYEAEMRYLKEAGQDFAEAHPDAAQYLKMQDSLERDPMVERLFEGFAFLTAKLYQKIDDDMPELTESALALLWPHHLQPVASMSIVQLMLNKQIYTNDQHIPAGLKLQTAVDSNTGISCEYRTTQAVDIYPVDVGDFRLVYNDLGQSIIQLRLQLRQSDAGQNICLPDQFSLKFHLVGEIETRLSIYHYLINHLAQITTDENYISVNDKLTLQRAHFDSDSITWLQQRQAGEHDLLMEYFLFKEKFLFFELKGLSGKDFDNDKHELLVNCHLQRDFPLELVFNREYLKLFCVPVINLFDLEAEPVVRSHLHTEYRLSPMFSASEQVNVCAVTEVESFSKINGNRKRYLPFNEFRHGKRELSILEQDNPYYYIRTRQGIGNKYDSFISFSGEMQVDEEEIFSISILGANGNLPRQITKYNKKLSLHSPVLGVKDAQMVMVPTALHYPPDYKNQQWQLLFEMSNNYLATLDTGTLKNSLRLLNWSTAAANEKNIAAITSVQSEIKHIMHQGMMIRCLVINIELDSTGFINEADAALFGYVLNRYLIAYAQLNLAIKVNVILQPEAITLSWPINVDEKI